MSGLGAVDTGGMVESSQTIFRPQLSTVVVLDLSRELIGLGSSYRLAKRRCRSEKTWCLDKWQRSEIVCVRLTTIDRIDSVDGDREY